MNRAEHVKRLEWAVWLSQAEQLRPGDWLNLKEDLIDFVRGSGTTLDISGTWWNHPTVVERRIVGIQKALRAYFERLAEVGVAKAVRTGPGPILEEVGISFPVRGSFTIGAFPRGPYRLLVKTDTIESQVYSALASYLVSSGTVAGQIRKCPTCGRLFLYKRKPRTDKTLHCSLRCSRLEASRRYRKKNQQRLRPKERERGHQRYVQKQQRKHGPRVKVERRPHKAKGDYDV